MIKKNDLVKILAGKDAGKTGKVEKVLPKDKKVVVTGINIAKKHLKPTKYRTQAGIIDKAMPLDQSNVMIMCPKCNKPSRTGVAITDDRKARVCKKCKEVIDYYGHTSRKK